MSDITKNTTEMEKETELMKRLLATTAANIYNNAGRLVGDISDPNFYDPYLYINITRAINGTFRVTIRKEFTRQEGLEIEKDLSVRIDLGTIDSVTHNEQKPKKPLHYKAHPSDIFLCAGCKSSFIVNSFGNKMPYCPNCGIKQDWREEDE